MDKIEKIVAEQLAGEDYEITEWRKFRTDEHLRELTVNLGKIKIHYQQTDGYDYFYGGLIIDEFHPAIRQIDISITTSVYYNYKRDVDFVRSILPELEVMLSKVQAYRELAK